MVRRAEYVYSVTLSILSVMSMSMAVIPVDNLIIMQFSILKTKRVKGALIVWSRWLELRGQPGIYVCHH